MTAPTVSEIYEELSSAQIAGLRRRAQTDLFFLSKAILGYTQVTEKTHAALCLFLVQETAERRMVLMPRGWLKSSVCTISDSCRKAIADPDNTRILILNEIEDNAIGFLKELKGHWTGGGLLPMLFPELVPVRMAGPGSDWSMTAASVHRTSVYKESTWTAMGVGGSAMSQHYSHIKCDDLVGRRAKASAAEMQTTTAWTKDAPFLLDRLENQLDFYGTRKAIGDTYESLMERWPSMPVFSMEPLVDGETTFPKITTTSLLKIMVETPEEWAHDYMNNPIGQGGVDWGRGFLCYYTMVKDEIRFTDPVTEKPKRWKLGELDIVLTADPNSGKPLAPDRAAVVVHGVSPDDEIFVLSSRSNRWSPDELIDAIWSDCGRWHPRVVGIEEAGQQNTIYYFEKRCSKERLFYHIEPLKHKNVEKEKRIRTALDSPLRAKRLFVLATAYTLINQIQFFPQLAVHNWDEIDALSHGPQLYRNGMREEDREAAAEAEAKVLSTRGLTGYGNSFCRRVQS